MGSSTEEQWAAPPWMSASGGQLSTKGKQSSSLAPAAKVHQTPGETSPACAAAPLCESQSQAPENYKAEWFVCAADR